MGTFDNKIAFEIMKDQLGVDPNELFEFDPPTPIASASIVSITCMTCGIPTTVLIYHLFVISVIILIIIHLMYLLI